MADIEDAIYTRLSGHAGLSALVGTRIYPGELPPDVNVGESFPDSVVYFPVDDETVSAMGVDTGLVRARFQFDGWSRTYDGAKAIRKQLKLALQRWRGTFASVVIQDTFILSRHYRRDPVAELHGAGHDAMINYEE